MVLNHIFLISCATKQEVHVKCKAFLKWQKWTTRKNWGGTKNTDRREWVKGELPVSGFPATPTLPSQRLPSECQGHGGSSGGLSGAPAGFWLSPTQRGPAQHRSPLPKPSPTQTLSSSVANAHDPKAPHHQQVPVLHQLPLPEDFRFQNVHLAVRVDAVSSFLSPSPAA